MISKFKKLLIQIVSVISVIAVAGCGTIIYPERKGQIDGKLDTDIVILNALGLLFFLVPGVIAFAVDFSNGTIYLPKGRSSSLNPEELRLVTSGEEVNLQALKEVMSTKALFNDLDVSDKEILLMN